MIVYVKIYMKWNSCETEVPNHVRLCAISFDSARRHLEITQNICWFLMVELFSKLGQNKTTINKWGHQILRDVQICYRSSTGHWAGSESLCGKGQRPVRSACGKTSSQCLRRVRHRPFADADGTTQAERMCHRQDGPASPHAHVIKWQNGLNGRGDIHDLHLSIDSCGPKREYLIVTAKQLPCRSGHGM